MHHRTAKPLILPGTFLGIGMGGFVDGIILHQILQTHSMVTGRLPKDTVANMEINMFWDGMFHALTWTMTAIGLALLWRAVKRTDIALAGKVVFGAMIFGWGLFNLVEGIIDHHILHLHHVVEAHGVSVYDYAFLLSGVLMIVIGQLLIRSGRRASERHSGVVAS